MMGYVAISYCFLVEIGKVKLDRVELLSRKVFKKLALVWADQSNMLMALNDLHLPSL